MTQTVDLFGIRAAIRADGQPFFARLKRHLPAGSMKSDAAAIDADLRYRVTGPRCRSPRYVVVRDRRMVAVTDDAVRACEHLAQDLQSSLSRLARGWTFIH